MSKRKGRLSLVTSIGVCLIGSGGCASDAASNDGAVIKLGVFIREGGDSADEILAAREINAGGGITIGDTNYTIELVREYDGASAEGGAEAVEKFVAQGAIAAIGPRWSSILLGDEPDFDNGAAAKAIESDMIVISGNTTGAAITTLEDDDLIWRTIPSDDLQGEACAHFAVEERGVETAAILYRDDAWGRGLSARFSAVFEDIGGTVVAAKSFDPELDLEGYAFPELEDVLADQPGMLFLLAFGESPQITHRMVQGGHLQPYGDELPLIMATDGSYDTNLLINAAPEVLPHLLGTLPGRAPSDPVRITYGETFEEAGFGPALNAWPYPYDAIYVLAMAIQSAQSLRTRDIKAHLQRVSIDDGEDDLRVDPGEWADARQALLDGQAVDYNGASGPIDFTAEGDPGAGFFALWQIVEDDSGDFAIEFDDESTVEFRQGE
jgi:ABC-type branched-subunit amino acid transport system substrate-binding protein